MIESVVSQKHDFDGVEHSQKHEFDGVVIDYRAELPNESSGTLSQRASLLENIQLL